MRSRSITPNHYANRHDNLYQQQFSATLHNNPNGHHPGEDDRTHHNGGSNPHSTANTKKYYNREEVSYILKSTIESKLHKIYKELDEKQKIIKVLNERLEFNEKKLS